MLKKIVRSVFVVDDRVKFRLLAVAASILVCLVLLSNLFEEYFRAEVLDYFQRRSYYERVISNRGLPLHRGMHWQEKK